MSHPPLPEPHPLNYIHPDLPDSDRDLFLNSEPAYPLDPAWGFLSQVLHHSGAFPSINQARKAGWDIPIPPGYSQWTVGKARNRKDIFILNKF